MCATLDDVTRRGRSCTSDVAFSKIAVSAVGKGIDTALRLSAMLRDNRFAVVTISNRANELGNERSPGVAEQNEIEWNGRERMDEREWTREYA